MDDLVSRQSALDALKKCRKHCCREDDIGDKWIHYETALNEIESILSVHPEIIRCKDCDWWTKQDDSQQGKCIIFQMYPTGRWFCGYAIRREVTT